MARSVTCETLKRQIRELADQETDAPTQSPVDDAELLGMLNASLGLWHSKVAQADPERFESEDTIVADGSTAYDLPADYYKTLGVDYLYSDNAYWPLDRVLFQERTSFDVGDGLYAAGYRVKGASLVLIPAVNSGTYRHTYVTCAPVFTSDADTLDGCNGWEQWIVYDCAIKLLIKEGSTEEAAALVPERDRIEAEINAAAADREAATPRRVAGTRARFFSLLGAS